MPAPNGEPFGPMPPAATSYAGMPIAGATSSVLSSVSIWLRCQYPVADVTETQGGVYTAFELPNLMTSVCGSRASKTS